MYTHTSFYSEVKLGKGRMTKANEVYIDATKTVFFCCFCITLHHLKIRREKKKRNLLQKYDS